jgi:hypothetical protein
MKTLKRFSRNAHNYKKRLIHESPIAMNYYLNQLAD